MNEQHHAWRRKSGFAIGGALIVMGWVLAMMPDKMPPDSFQAVAVRKVMSNPWIDSPADIARLDAAEQRDPVTLHCGTWKSEVQPGSTEALAGELRTRSELVLRTDGRYSLDVLALVDSANYRPPKHVARGHSDGRFTVRGAIIVFERVQGDSGLLPESGRVAISSASSDRLVLDIGGGTQWTFAIDKLEHGRCPRVLERKTQFRQGA